MTKEQALLRLQEIDLALIQRKQAVDELPDAQRVRELRAQKKKLQSQLKVVVGRRKDIQMDLDDVAKRLERAKAAEDDAKVQAAEGTIDHRQIKNFETHLSDLAKRVEKCEFEQANLQAEYDKLAQAEKNADALAAKLDAGEKEALEACQGELRRIREEVNELNREREAVAAVLGEDLLATYQKAFTRFKGLAVEQLRGNYPTVCRVKLQPAAYHQLVRSSTIAECPYCHRILILSEEADEQ